MSTKASSALSTRDLASHEVAMWRGSTPMTSISRTFLKKRSRFPEARPPVGLVYGDAALMDAQSVELEDPWIAVGSRSAHADRDAEGDEYLSLILNYCIPAPTVIARNEVWRKSCLSRTGSHTLPYQTGSCTFAWPGRMRSTTAPEHSRAIASTRATCTCNRLTRWMPKRQSSGRWI